MPRTAQRWQRGDRPAVPSSEISALDAAQRKAEEIVASVQGGRVVRDPIGGSCPDWCSFQPICRRERGLPEEEPWSEDGEEE